MDGNGQGTTDPTINQVSPIGGALAGGITVTITGTGFQKGAIAYFGSQLASATDVEDENMVKAVVPAATKPDSVEVTVVNPDSSQFTLVGGFTYVTMENSDRAEVMGVSPLTVIEGVDTVVTLRGRNLILAYNEGLLALRCPTRATLRISKVDTNSEEVTGIETVSFHITVSASLPLEPLERIAVQVLASRRAGAQDDLIAESSKQMFTVLPANIPVPLAYSPGLNKDKPTMVMVLGRNLEGCTLEFGGDVETQLQQSNERFLAGIVTVPEGMTEGTTSTHVSVLDNQGNSVAQYNLTIANSAELLRATPVVVPDQSYLEGSPRNNDKPFEGSLSIDFVPVSGQAFLGPTAEDSSVYDLRSESQSATESFIWINFQIVIADVYIILPIINEVYMVALFDGGGDEFESPILAQVGKLFPVRGLGILVAARVEVTIHITVILIISIYFDIFDFGLFNEFSEFFPEAIATVTVGLIVEIEVLITISFLNALVLPDGRMRLLFAFNLTIGIDFTISTDGRHLNFEPNFSHSIRFFGIHPFSESLPCGGQFQLAADNGQTVFTDVFGGQQSFYFARSAGRCCAPWRFELELVRFSSGGNEEVIQFPFNAEICINALASPNLMDVIITSVPPPEGVPPTLVMDVGDSAVLKALAQPVDENGNPNGPLQDIRDLGYGVEFYLEEPLELLDPNTLPPGDAYAIQSGQNLIRAAVTSVRVVDEGPLYTFFPNSILGFDIIRFLAQGQPPRLRVGGLPLNVNALAASTITVEPILAYRDSQNNLVAAPLVSNQLQPAKETWELERYEPFENQREFLLTVKVDIPTNVNLPQTLEFTVQPAKLKSFADGSPIATNSAPLQATFGNDRGSDKPEQFFTGSLTPNPAASFKVNLTINSRPGPNDLLEVPGLKIKPNVKEVAATLTTPIQLVPPGKKLTGKNVLLTIPLKCTPRTSNVHVAFPKPELNIVIRNDETFEEYLRVFDEINTMLTNAGTNFSNLANDLLTNLNNPGTPPTPINDILRTKGETLWTNACTKVQTSYDDRPLYWARLQGIGAIRAYAKRNNITSTSNPSVEDLIKKFEYPSRGLDAVDGGIKFPTNLPSSNRKAIVTGFDPFGLVGSVGYASRSNPSGLIAQFFNGNPSALNQADVYVRTAIFPVRFQDFNGLNGIGIVENAIMPSLGSIIMLVTTSENNVNYYDIERWACRFRSDGTDNNNKQGTSDPSIPPLIPNGAEFLESTLPYELVITSQESLEGPMGMAPFVIDQAYKNTGATRNILERRGPPPAPPVPPTTPLRLEDGQFRPSPLLEDEDGHTKKTDAPTGTSRMGSGENYLSNEIFYRAALVRETIFVNRSKKLPSGHIHVPQTGFNPGGTGSQLIVGVKKALNRLFAHGFRFSVTGTTTFPATIINQSSQEQILTITNDSTETLKINAVDVAAPFSVILPPPTPPNTNPLPITVNANSSVTLPFKFTPTIAGAQTGNVTLRELSGEVLRIFELKGEGIQSQPPPVITGFSPTIVYRGDFVTVNGQYFTRTTQVKIGNTNVNYGITSDTELEIEAEALSGKITIVTLFGAVTSVDTLHIVFRPPDV